METLEKTEEKKQKILKSYDKFQLDKIAWLNNVYDEEINKKPLWSVYNNNIHDIEIAKNKDLKDFNKDEAVSMMNSFIYAMPSTLNTIKVFVNKYFDYWVEKGEIMINPLLGEQSLKGTNHSKNMLKSKLINMKDFYNILSQMKQLEKIRPENLKPLLLARYGVVGKQAINMRCLRYKDIDIVNKFVNIYNENNEFVTLIPIDDRFIDFLAEIDGGVEEESKQSLYKSDAYVLETRQILNYNTVNNRVYTAFKFLNEWGNKEVEGWENVERISFNNLVFTRQIELLLQIREHRRLTIIDVENIILIMSNDDKTYADLQLKKKYMSLTKDKVLDIQYGQLKKSINKVLEANMVDPFAIEEVKRIRKEIGFEEDIIEDIINDFIDEEDASYQEGINSAIKDHDDYVLNYEPKEKEKESQRENINKSTYSRDSKVGLNALKLAYFKCELDSKHETFVSNSTSRNYVEAHHLIPIKYYYSDEFQFSIDNEANIVALCPNCHRLLHFGQLKDKVGLLKKLYDKREQDLKKAGILITFDTLKKNVHRMFKRYE